MKKAITVALTLMVAAVIVFATACGTGHEHKYCMILIFTHLPTRPCAQ